MSDIKVLQSHNLWGNWKSRTWTMDCGQDKTHHNDDKQNKHKTVQTTNRTAANRGELLWWDTKIMILSRWYFCIRLILNSSRTAIFSYIARFVSQKHRPTSRETTRNTQARNQVDVKIGTYKTGRRLWLKPRHRCTDNHMVKLNSHTKDKRASSTHNISDTTDTQQL